MKLGQKNQPDALNAAQVNLDLSWRQITDPRFFDRIALINGRLDLNPSSMNIPIRANTLQLNKMALAGDANDWKIDGQQVNAGIYPWQPKKGHLLGENTEFQLSAASLSVNGIPAENILVQGQINNNQLTLSNFGGDLARGQLTGKASRAPDGSWTVDNVRLSNVRLQTSETLSAFLQDIKTMPKVSIKRFDLIDARLQGQDWAFSDVDLSVKDVNVQDGDWQSQDGEVSLNATEMINGNLHVIDPIVNLDLSPQGIAIRQVSARWEGGLLRTTGNWIRESKRLQLNELTVAALEYTLPQNWRQLWVQALPSWLSEVYVGKLMTNRNLIIDISPQFPFQLTALDGYGGDLLLARNHEWGIWSGKLNLNASDATFNKVDVRRPSLALEAADNQVKITELSAFTKEGLLEATANVDQQPQRHFSMTLNGRAVPVNVLENWGWPHIPSEGNANMQLSLQGQIPANVDFKPTLNGKLHATTADGKQLDQQMSQGVVAESSPP